MCMTCYPWSSIKWRDDLGKIGIHNSKHNLHRNNVMIFETQFTIRLEDIKWHLTF